MKPTAYLINTSRGGLIDEQALCQAINEGMIAGAGIDVTDPEPPQPDNPLLKLEQVLISGHSAWFRKQACWTCSDDLRSQSSRLSEGLRLNTVQIPRSCKRPTAGSVKSHPRGLSEALTNNDPRNAEGIIRNNYCVKEKTMSEFGQMGVDWEERVNFDRLRRERLQKARDAMEEADVDALFIFCNEDVRYVRATGGTSARAGRRPADRSFAQRGRSRPLFR